MNIQIKKNDYVQPSIREDVLQEIVTAIVEQVCDNERVDYIKVHHRKPYLCLLKDMRGRVSPFSADDEKDRKVVRLRTCEMEKAFEIIQDAGYFICAIHVIGCGDDDTYYHFTKKPYYKEYKCERADFGYYID